MKYQRFKIPAIRYISKSELEIFLSEDFNYHDTEKISKILYDLGMDTNLPYEEQHVLHRNNFDEISHCLRWVGDERTDAEWINSGYASDAAKDKASGNVLLADLYRTKGKIE